MKQIIKKILLITILHIGLILISTNVYAASGKTTNETTRLRREASTDSETVALISQNTDVEVVGEEGDWYKVTYSGNTGYIRKDMLTVEGEVTDTNTTSNKTVENSTGTEQQNEISNTTTNTTEEEQATENATNETVNNGDSQDNQNTSTEENTENTNTLEIGYTGKLTSSVDIKILPVINSSIIATVNENTEFTVIDVINRWCHIETDTNSGWVLLSKIKTDAQSETTSSAQEENKNEAETEETNTTETNANTTTIKYVSTETLNVRESADNNAEIVEQLNVNTQVTVDEVVDSTWSKITVNGITGYVASKYLSDTKVTTSSRSEDLSRSDDNTEKNDETKSDSKETTDSSNSSQSSKTTGSEVVDYAKKYLGYKYVSGGASPATGFDCSGFTYYVYKHFGITLSRTSTAQASNGVAVTRANLQNGDLVIFNNSSNSAIGHVGIYIGGNSFIHAANATKGVITTSLSDSYYQARYVTGRRVIN